MHARLPISTPALPTHWACHRLPALRPFEGRYAAGRFVAGRPAAGSLEHRTASPRSPARWLGGSPAERAYVVATAALLAAVSSLWLSSLLPLAGVPARELPNAALSLLAIAGIVMGFLSGMLGIGGALISVPALSLLLPWLGIAPCATPKIAIVTALVAMLPTASMAAWNQYRAKRLDLPALRALAPSMVAGAVGGGTLALLLDGRLLGLLFATQSLVYGLRLVRRAAGEGARLRRWCEHVCALPAWTAGSLMSGISACAGMGAGTLVVPYLQMRGLTLARATATSNALNLAVAFGATLLFAVSGASGASAAVGGAGVGPQWQAALALGGFAVLTVPAGVAFAPCVPAARFRRVLGVVTLLGAGVLLLRVACA